MEENPNNENKDNNSTSSTGTDNINAFNKLASNVTSPDTVKTLDNINVPKKLSRLGALLSVGAGLLIILIGTVFAFYEYHKTHKKSDLVVLLSVFLFFGLLLIITQLIRFRQLRNAGSQLGEFNQFQTGTVVNYQAQVKSTSVGIGTKIIGWLGPVNVAGLKGVGVTVLGHETDRQSVNTLIFTEGAVVAIMLGPQDVPAELAGGTLNQIASAGINFSSGQAVEKNESFVTLYQRKWDKIMTPLLNQDINQIIANHFNYNVPYEQIDHAQIRNSFINPELIFNLKDGSKLAFISFRKDLLEQSYNYLSNYLTISK